MSLSFDVLDDGEATCPHVASFPRYRPEDLVQDGAINPVIIAQDSSEIEFDYPLSRRARFTFTSPGGFTAWDFYRAVYEGYTRIYGAETSEAGDPGHLPGTLNRAPSEGPYGIWGHGMDDLYLEGYREVEPGRFRLGIGS